jgi:hypothetical protein
MHDFFVGFFFFQTITKKLIYIDDDDVDINLQHFIFRKLRFILRFNVNGNVRL